MQLDCLHLSNEFWNNGFLDGFRTKQWLKVKRSFTWRFPSGRGVCCSSHWSSPRRPRRRRRRRKKWTRNAAVTKVWRFAARSMSGRSLSTSFFKTPPSSPSDCCSSSTTKSSATWTSSSPAKTRWSSFFSSTGSSSFRPKSVKDFAIRSYPKVFQLFIQFIMTISWFIMASFRFFLNRRTRLPELQIDKICLAACWLMMTEYSAWFELLNIQFHLRLITRQ